jgi:CRISPR-associated protein Csd2
MALTNRYDFVLIFDVKDGNPNGDPDAGNLPRLDAESGHGLVTDVCLKRKVRDLVQMLGRPGAEIFVKSRLPLNPLIAEACDALGKETFSKGEGKWDTEKAKKRPQADIRELQSWLCKRYFDIRTFGAVLSTGPNAGQLKGPVQMTFARSVDPIVALEHTITRVTDTDKEEGEMGRKHTVPYGLYVAHGFVSAFLARQTGFGEDDLELLWQALEHMFEHDRSAARGEMATRGLYVFKHDSELGNAHAHSLFERLKVTPKEAGALARDFGAYSVKFDGEALAVGASMEAAPGVTVTRRC